jgi:hypothetical protein
MGAAALENHFVYRPSPHVAALQSSFFSAASPQIPTIYPSGYRIEFFYAMALVSKLYALLLGVV